MADSSITGLSGASAVDGTEVLPIDQSSSTVKVTIADLTPGLNEFTGDAGSPATPAKGLVPAPASGDAAAGKFLSADGTWDTPAGASGGMAKIAQVVTASSQSTISFSSIPSTYTDLLIILQGRDTSTTSTENGVRLQVNGDSTSSNYSSVQIHSGFGSTNSSSAVAASSTGGHCADIPGSSGNANAVGVSQILIANYKGTTFHKMVSSLATAAFGATPSLDNVHYAFVWKNTAAINALVITAGGTAFVDGSTATLYGLG